MNTCKYPEIKFISFLIFSQYQMRIKKIIKIKTFSYLPTQTFFRRLPETHVLFFRPYEKISKYKQHKLGLFQDEIDQENKFLTEFSSKIDHGYGWLLRCFPTTQGRQSTFSGSCLSMGILMQCSFWQMNFIYLKPLLMPPTLWDKKYF